MNPNIKLKRSLVLQSFFPLFFLLLVKYMDFGLFFLIKKFFLKLFRGDLWVIISALQHEKFLILILVLISCCWLLAAIWADFQLKDVHTANFCDFGERIKIDTFITDAGVVFYVTFVIPLVMDDLGNRQNFLVFVIMMGMLMQLMWKTNLYYQNPILTILGFKVFEFQFENPGDSRLKNKTFIGITKGTLNEQKIIKRQYISDNVFLIYNKNQDEE